MPLLASISHMEARDLDRRGRRPDHAAISLRQAACRVFPRRSALCAAPSQMSDVDNPPQGAAGDLDHSRRGQVDDRYDHREPRPRNRACGSLLIDGDLRHPSASRYFKAERSWASSTISSAAPSSQKVARLRRELAALGAARRRQDAEPAGPARLGTVQGADWALRSKFDLIVIDTPPMGPVVDPLIVVAARSTRSSLSCAGPRRRAKWSRIRSSAWRAIRKWRASSSITSSTPRRRNTANTPIPIITAAATTRNIITNDQSQRIAVLDGAHSDGPLRSDDFVGLARVAFRFGGAGRQSRQRVGAARAFDVRLADGGPGAKNSRSTSPLRGRGPTASRPCKI